MEHANQKFNFVDVCIDVKELEKLAVEIYSECPRYMTIVLKADGTDRDTDFHCAPANPKVGPPKPKRSFEVSKQWVIMAQDKEFGLFSVIWVRPIGTQEEFWLITSERSRMGFLLEHGVLPFDELSFLKQVEEEEVLA